jgi:hypothetical protein
MYAYINWPYTQRDRRTAVHIVLFVIDGGSQTITARILSMKNSEYAKLYPPPPPNVFNVSRYFFRGTTSATSPSCS